MEPGGKYIEAEQQKQGRGEKPLTLTFLTTLPIPPTMNHAFSQNKQGRRFVSPEYRTWRDIAGQCLKHNHPNIRKIEGKIRAVYEYNFGDNRKRDLANFEKGVSDLLVEHGVINDDSDIDELTLIRGTSGAKRFVVVKIEALS
jgi:crossover junction endodeoxyribonuclease RusA